MKVIILGDTHFGGGYSLGRPHSKLMVNSRLVDFSNTFDHVINHMIDNSINDLIITGDIFDSRKPQAYELSLFSKKVQKCRKLGISIHIIIGNHDLLLEQNATTLDFLKNLQLKNVFIHSDIVTKVIENGQNKINFIFIPFRNRFMLGAESNDDAVEKLKENIKFEMSRLSSDPKIVVGHLMFDGTKLGNMVVEGDGREVVVPPKMFDDLDGVIMGHVHQHDIISKSNPFLSYVGSMERKDFGEQDKEKKFLEIEYNGINISYNFYNLPVRELFDIDLNMSDVVCGKELLENIKKHLLIHDKEESLKNGIIRLNISVSDKAMVDFDKNQLIKFLFKEIRVNNCVGVHTQIVSHRQLRKSSITERNTPLQAFYDFLELEQDAELKNRMRQVGKDIIEGE